MIATVVLRRMQGSLSDQNTGRGTRVRRSAMARWGNRRMQTVLTRVVVNKWRDESRQ